ncbi:Putative major facilitator superfamily, MFS transporter superfamily [Colletotrichum destructivum]|uniref:Major facilitator superfamily, MFS transporter superfamily n=1 Tax=Colletotrichum destructivum TaxID=34406 RepID=A0AAX4IFY4_9PEZI|nr:Putative major facilitator superfamily, MFS transporter superfamily [Colletotrichum destructivum]
MTTIVTAKPATESSSDSDSVVKSVPNETVIPVAPLGKPRPERKFWFQKRQHYDPSAIATLPSVYDDPSIASKYKPRDNWYASFWSHEAKVTGDMNAKLCRENIHRFNPSARWTWAEEDDVIRRTDWRIMIWACALTDNFLNDLGLSTNDYNLGNTLFSLSFLCAELPSQLVSKWAGPDRWIPTQLVLWSLVAACQFKLNGLASFLICRCLLGFLQGGFIPDIILYLSYFYKHAEMTIRLGFFWMAMTFADILCALFAYGILHMRGVHGHEGWRWLFLIEGLLTMAIGFLSFLFMPAGPTQTASWFREIMVNRIIRDDASKGSMHNRERITLRLLWKSVCDYDLWPIYLIGFTFLVPSTTPRQYLTLSLRGLGFNTFHTNLLVIPSQALSTLSMMLLLWIAERTKQLLAWSAFSQIWMLPFLIWLRVVDTTKASKWTVWIVMTLMLTKPQPHPIQVNLASRNSNAVRSRTVSAALYNMCVQVGGIIGSNIYRADDAPGYRRGNSVLLGIVAWNLCIYAGARGYYIWRNRVRDQKWDAFRADEKVAYLDQNEDGGSKRLDFRFAY